MNRFTTFLKGIPAWAAKIGQLPDFGYFFAHAGVAQYAMTRFPAGPPRICAAIVGVAVAAWKEFIFDPKHEVNPPQNRWPDGAKDFAGYLAGIVVGCVSK